MYDKKGIEENEGSVFFSTFIYNNQEENMLGADIYREAVQRAKGAKRVYCKFIAAKDTVQMTGRPAGIYISKKAQEILFQHPLETGINQEREVIIVWQNQLKLKNRFIYYGKRLRNEYCITQFPEKFPYLQENLVGSLFFLIEESTELYRAYVISEEYEIRNVLDSFHLSPIETDMLVGKEMIQPFALEKFAINKFIKELNGIFPTEEMLSEGARNIYYEVYNLDREEITMPDRIYLSWLNMENRLFRLVENELYSKEITETKYSLASFLEKAEEIKQKRNERMKVSVMNHLKEVFLLNGQKVQIGGLENTKNIKYLIFSAIQKENEAEQKLEWILNIQMLCKDSWKNDLQRSSADRKIYLFTLQQGLSSEVLLEMEKKEVVLVVPKQYIDCYPIDRKYKIWSIAEYIQYIESMSV